MNSVELRIFCRHFQDSPETLLRICQTTRPYNAEDRTSISHLKERTSNWEHVKVQINV